MVVPGLPYYLVEKIASVVDSLFYHYDLLVLRRPYTGEIYTLFVIGDPTTLNKI